MDAHGDARTPHHDRGFLKGGGELGARIRAFDWTQTPLGPPESWPTGLKTAIRIMLTSRQAMWIGWGPELTYVYNDAYKSIVGGKHPTALGQPTAVVWREIWDQVAPRLATALGGDEGTYDEAQLLIMERNGYPEETYYTFSYSPIPNDDGSAGGIICANTDDTERVVRERQLKLLRQLAASAAHAHTVTAACEMLREALGSDSHDVPFALMYLASSAADQFVLAAAVGIAPGHPAAPPVVGVGASTPWPFAAAATTNSAQVVRDLTSFESLPHGAWNRPPHQAILVPLSGRGQQAPIGMLVVGLNPYRLLDDGYRGFIDLVAGQISTNIANATAYQDERRRADMLVELDRAKTAFFSNVSHEFRTPLTLMLGPLEDVLAGTDQVPEHARELLAVARRNGLRLSKLVNNLLDFSRIEAGRVQASFEPTDLAALTADLASVFRSAIERAGMRLVVDCPPLAEPIHVDRDMWEKVVLNLISNALKFTFEGTIAVRLRADGDGAVLTVADTGTGIAAEELRHVFERFHRVRGARSRTQEGTGIGLALVQELVRLHGGSISAESVVGEGTTFRVTIPAGLAHLPPESLGAPRTLMSTSVRAEAYVNEATGWVGEPTPSATAGEPLQVVSALPRLLLADDNADMRDYVGRLLGDRWQVEAVADGSAALASIQANPPHVVVTDVMMPGLDGFELLQALRSDAETAHIPVLLLSARAGEEATLEGIAAGADDYLVKPFTARDLIGRLEAQLSRARQHEALRERTAQIEGVINNAPLGVYLVNEDFRIAQVNPTARPTFGDIPDLIGRDFDEVIHLLWAKDYADELVRLFRHTLQTGEPYVARERAEFRIDRGVTEYYDWRIDRIPLPDGRHGVVCYFQDVSLQVMTRRIVEESEARFRNLAGELQEANRVKDEFLATLSHELRTPLNAILGWAHILRTGPSAATVHEKALESLERNARAQAKLVEDLLDVSRIISGKLSIRSDAVDVGSLVTSAVETVMPAAIARHVEVAVAVDPEVDVLVTGDADRLHQVAWNLLSNAVKFTDAGGRIDVSVRHSESAAELVVRDTGQGIDPSFLPYVFERFRQADSTPGRKHGGLGLGLSIVRHLVEAHGGTVHADSEGLRQGATFTVRLPLRSATPRVAVPPVEASRMPFSGAHALVVDDEPDALDVIRFVLAAQGARITTASSAAEALDVLTRERVDVLIADIGLPAQDGYELIRMVRGLPSGRGTRTPAIAVTAYASLRERERALDAGYDWHLTKPIDPDQLAATVGMAVGGRVEIADPSSLIPNHSSRILNPES